MPGKEIILKGSTTDQKPSKLTECHLMPCRIEHSGHTVKASEYFLPTIKVLKAGGDEEEGRDKSYRDTLQNENPTQSTLTASFRGRPLQGRKMKLPEGFAGHAIVKDPRVKDKTTRELEEFTYWNWDELPSDEDTVVKALRWINIAKAIHGNAATD